MYKKKICKCKARAKIFMRAFCSSRTDFRMEKTAVSLPPHVSKGFERIIYQQIITYMEGKLLKCLTVFRNSHVIQHLLVTMLGKRKKTVDKGECVSADLSKSFDTINHDLLLAQLRDYRFSLNALKLMYSYLINRK